MKWSTGLLIFGMMISGPLSQAAVVPAPVVVELFESQGCSSCPPSEHTLSRLEQEFGDKIILLTFHVDYWDYLGWKDTFSDAQYTERQKMYGRAFAQDSIYTPEMVIGGETGFNGSDTSRAIDEIRSRLASPQPSIQMTLSPKTAKTSELAITLPPELAHGDHHLLAILVEDAPPVHVLRGENRGETMTGNFAVRSMTSIPQGQMRINLTLPLGGNPDRTRVAVLVRGNSSIILTANLVPWSSSKKIQ